MTANSTRPERVSRGAVLKWVPISMMRVNPVAQRELQRSWVNDLVANFDPEQIGTPTVNKRGSYFNIMDGQHRVEVMREVGWGDQQVQCWVYEGLTDEEEAETFLKLNHRKNVPALPEFRAAVTANRAVECDIDRIVRAAECKITADKTEGAISAVGTLIRIYERSGPATLARTIGIIRDSFGSPGLEADLLDGIGYLCGRYESELQDELTVLKLNRLQGGVAGLRNRAEVIRQRYGLTRGHAIAAAAVDIINAGKGGRKLASWFREDASLGAEIAVRTKA